ncbi:phage shock protein G [Vibrio sp. 10N.286.49.B3]|uniref:envelope stress response protein PspG n=1 Tax=Vibrio sp. 10N.286.49.B3 TaxID=1880855 RepID=UPI000C831F5A|nr:envelope stress response protein PspG [Vibrio sp. 10N.286.49.B3]PMH44358.1 phage shock protein G [Vibrio sp. 10N.286.49.B3]
MFELMFIVIFFTTLLVTGLTMATVIAATVISFIVLFFFGMLGVIFKVLPWLILIAIGIWFFTRDTTSSRRY